MARSVRCVCCPLSWAKVRHSLGDSLARGGGMGGRGGCTICWCSAADFVRRLFCFDVSSSSGLEEAQATICTCRGCPPCEVVSGMTAVAAASVKSDALATMPKAYAYNMKALLLHTQHTPSSVAAFLALCVSSDFRESIPQPSAFHVSDCFLAPRGN